MTSIRRSRRAGFSLLEVTLAIVVTGVALVGIYAMIPISVQNVGRSSNDTRVAQFVEEVIAGLEGKALQMRHQRKLWFQDFRSGRPFLEVLPSSSEVMESASTMYTSAASDAPIRVNGIVNDLEWSDIESTEKYVSHKLWYRIKLLEQPALVSRMRNAQYRDGKSKVVKIEVWTRPVKQNTTLAPDAVVFSEILNPVF